MKQFLQNQKNLVQNVFNDVYDKYDLMNDFMSLGIHRLWKKDLIMMMSPYANKKLIDVGCGTGDIGKLFLNTVKFKGSVYNVDPNKKMLDQGKKRFKNLDNISWHIGNAENLKFKSNLFDYYTISFGLRNTKDISKSLKEAHRVLKPGGRFLCLEFSKISNSNLNFLYKNYSKIIPKVGKLIVGKSEPYEYLIKSIDKFINQYQLIKLMNENGFENCKYRDLSGGIVSIHSGWKVL
jgi:demethylmenaquinone methyltransferase/2-methoxy-6-polyprenyl-1,4-benzoquinol methylase